MLLASAATAATIALAACEPGETLTKSSLRAKQPLSPKLVAEIEHKNMAKESPILIRLFKEEAELEVWKQTRGGRYALLKTYPICRWSGELGPKIKEGDRQAPEGFYTVTPGQMNPLSSYYLAFNMGYPNAFDRAHGRTGSQLMVHGDCSSRGCYAMTDEQIGEIYALAREAFFGGQKAFQVQAYPFRMTPKNMARHRANPNMPFWKMLKEGYDHFAVTRLEPKVNVCEKRYVFNANTPANASTPVSFSPSGQCPSYEVPADILAAVHQKQARDKIRTAALVRTTPAAPIKTGADGGMNKVYLAALQETQSTAATAAATGSAPGPTPHGTIPDHVNPPAPAQPVYASKQAVTQSTRMMLASAATASETPPTSDGGFFDQVSQAIGLEDTETTPEKLVGQPQPVRTASRPASNSAAPEPKRQGAGVATPRQPAAPTPSQTPVAVAARKPQPDKPALRGNETPAPEARSATKPKSAPKTKPAPVVTAAARQPARREAAAPAPTSSSSTPSTMMALTGPVMRGAQPTLRTGSFESRWSALRR